MPVCTYDNPATMRRECWEDGNLLVSYGFEILRPFALVDIPARFYFFGANIGPWKTGQVFGDIAAKGGDQNG